MTISTISPIAIEISNISHRVWEFVNLNNLFCIADVQPPKLLKCPSENIIRRTHKSKIQVVWDEPEYSDNCGSYKECKIDLFTATRSNSEFQKGSVTKVAYIATDESGNKNEECIFNVIVKGNFSITVNRYKVLSKCTENRHIGWKYRD